MPGVAVSRSLLCGAGFAFILAAGLNDLDRLAAQYPGNASLIPDAFEAQTARVSVPRLLQSGSVAAAAEAAHRGLSADPLDRRAVAAAGAAALANGDAVSASARFALGAKLGWRDPLTQLYWFEDARRAKDHKAAALRLDAVLRSNPGYEGGGAFLALLEREPAGRAALAARLARRPEWLSRYLNPDPAIPTQQINTRADLLLDQAAFSAGCKEVRQFTYTLLGRRLVTKARALHRKSCVSSSETNQLEDQDFGSYAKLQDQDPFGWQAIKAADVSITSNISGEGGAVSLKNTGNRARPVLQQFVDIQASPVRLEIDQSGAALGASISCSDPRTAAPSGPAQFGGELLATRCGEGDIQVLAIWAPPESGQIILKSASLTTLNPSR